MTPFAFVANTWKKLAAVKIALWQRASLKQVFLTYELHYHTKGVRVRVSQAAQMDTGLL